jgi:surface antigen
MKIVRWQFLFLLSAFFILDLFIVHPQFVSAQSLDDINLENPKHTGNIKESQQTIISPLPDLPDNSAANPSLSTGHPVGIISPLADDDWMEEVPVPVEPAPDLKSMSLWGRLKYAVSTIFNKIFPSDRHRIIFHHPSPKPLAISGYKTTDKNFLDAAYAKNPTADFYLDPTQIFDDPNCEGIHNEKKSYSVAEAATYLSTLVIPYKEATSQGLKLQSKFKCKDAANTLIPQKAQEIYKASVVWNPEVKSSKSDYLQCTAFVQMSYNIAGTALPTSLGDAKNWIYATKTFDVYKSGESKIEPQVGDVAVWKDGPDGHVGVITKVDQDGQINIASSNSVKSIDIFNFVKKDGTISITDTAGNTTNWLPDYWLRLKKII